MRTITMLFAAACVAVLAVGCRNNNPAYYPQQEAVAIGPPRVNLYPLTAPPPGSVQPLQGSAPTRISSTTAEYAAPAPNYGGGYVAQVPAPAPAPMQAPAPVQGSYAPGMGVTSPFPTGTYCPPWAPAGSVCTVENMTAGMNPIVPIGDPPVIVNNLNTGQTYTTTSGQLPQPYAAPAYQPAPSYAPPPAATYPAPGYRVSSAAGAAGGTAATVAGTSTYRAPAAAPVRHDATEVRLVPALDVPPGNHPGDAAPSQWFEIVRPGNGPIRIGRVSSTCVCVGVRVPNRFVAAGERALIEARIVSRPPVNNLTYGIYVNVMEPVQTTLDADVTITLR